MKHVIKTDVGVVRQENQDRAAFFTKGEIVFAILCDGMGGHMGGSIASSVTIDTFDAEFKKANLNRDNISAWFTQTLQLALKAMRKRAEGNDRLLDMGTTLTAACVLKDEIVIFNIGDSRTYAFAGVLQQVTTDQNLRNYYIDNFHYTDEEASQLRGAAALTSALGPTKSVKPEAFVIDRKDVRFLVLTSDGIHDYISKPIFEQIIRNNETTLEVKAEELILLAIRGKSTDNLTALVVEVQE